MNIANNSIRRQFKRGSKGMRMSGDAFVLLLKMVDNFIDISVDETKSYMEYFNLRRVTPEAINEDIKPQPLNPDNIIPKASVVKAYKALFPSDYTISENAKILMANMVNKFVLQLGIESKKLMGDTCAGTIYPDHLKEAAHVTWFPDE